MRRRKINFWLQIRNQRWISSRMMYIDIWFNLNLPEFLYLRRREDVPNLGNSGKLNMNHMSIHIIRREIQRWFRIWSQKFIFAYAFKRKSRFKKFAWANQKNLMCIESALKFQFEICAYVDTCVISNSRIAHVQKIDFS